MLQKGLWQQDVLGHAQLEDKEKKLLAILIFGSLAGLQVYTAQH